MGAGAGAVPLGEVPEGVVSFLGAVSKPPLLMDAVVIQLDEAAGVCASGVMASPWWKVLAP